MAGAVGGASPVCQLRIISPAIAAMATPMENRTAASQGSPRESLIRMTGGARVDSQLLLKQRAQRGHRGMLLADEGSLERALPSGRNRSNGEADPIVKIMVLVLLVVLLIGTLPIYRYSREWGYYPSGIVAAILVILTVALIH